MDNKFIKRPEHLRIAAGQLREPDEGTLTMVRQLGLSSIQFNTPNLPGEARWEYEDLLALKNRCNEFGLFLESIENVPIQFYDKAMLGLPGRDEQIENYQAIIRHMGKAGIPVLGHHFMPNFVWRTTLTAEGRAGAKVTAFNMEEAEAQGNLIKYPANREGRVESEEQMWENYTYFIKAVLPVAEEAGVRLALHPDDPPVEKLDGVARLFYKPDQFKKAMEIANSEAWGLNLCLGCCSEMIGDAKNVKEMIDYFGPRGKIFYVHFRDVQGTVPSFQECFLGEGNFRPGEVLRRLQKSGFNGFLLDDHVPAIEGDTPWGHRARSHAIGYMQGLIEMMNTPANI